MSNKLVTGTDLSDILYSVKDYIDYNDLDFADATFEDEDTENIAPPRLTIASYNIAEEDVDGIINKYFADKDN